MSINKIVKIITGLRKWSIMMVIIIIGVLFLASGFLTGVEFVALIKGVGVAFMASNAVERTVESVVKSKKEDMSQD